jgi:DEAD/DEAH box helicase domain-containing protein
MAKVSEFTQFLENRFGNEIKSHTIIDPVSGMFEAFPDSLDPSLQAELERHKIRSLFSHQREAFNNISAGKNTVLVSQTASGKTLSFLLPILNEYLKAKPPFSVMLLYPTKALSRDQEGTLGKLMHAATDQLKLGTFDGDTPREERTRIQRSADFLITNPDMLHAGILPNHNRRWKNFLSRLKYIVVDEVHMYRGAFGSHVSNVFRRLLRVCEVHGSRPSFVCSSATIGNPGGHVKSLFHNSFVVIDRDGAPRPRRDLYMVNPRLVHSHGYTSYRQGPGSVSVHLIRKAAALNVRTICFCRARQQVERLHRAVVDGRPELRDKVKPYRGGFLPNERRQLERDLFEGKINTIITTNALELGIDVGDLDLCLLSGHPGTIASFWQQAGRVGRKGTRAVIVYIAKDTPIDQYLVNHPEFITSKPVEEAWLQADNPYIMLQHLPCAAHEHPLRETEAYHDQRAYNAAIEVLKNDKTLVPYNDCYRYALRDYPARGVNLRGMTDYNIEIHCGPIVIGELDPIGARGTLYKDAVYQHLGERYISLNLDLDKKLCHVEKVNVDYYTEAVWEGRVTMTDVEETQNIFDGKIDFGYITVNKQPKLYKKIRERSFENVGYGPITLEPFIYDTTGFCMFPPIKWQETMQSVDKRFIGAALYGLSYILRKTAPSQCMGDMKDIDTDVSLAEVDKAEWKSTLYLFDTHEGGVGYSERIFEAIDNILKVCLTVISECDCRSGCPACVTPLPPGVNDEELESFLVESNAAVMCTRSLLKVLIHGKIEVPEIKIEKSPISPVRQMAQEDQDLIKLNARLTKSAKIMKKKREKLH